VQSSAKKAAETVALVVDEEGAEILLSELLKGASDSRVISLCSSCSKNQPRVLVQVLMPTCFSRL
jgi:hypothetical protein